MIGYDEVRTAKQQNEQSKVVVHHCMCVGMLRI